MNLPEKITYSRFTFGLICLIFAFQRNLVLFSVFYILAVFSDILDGFVARKLKLVSEKGKRLDIIADNFLVFCVFFGLYLLGKMHHYLIFMLIFAYYILAQLLSYLMKKKLIFMRTLAANIAAIVFPFMIFSMLFFEIDFLIKIYAFLMFYSLTEKISIMFKIKWIWLLFLVLTVVSMILGPKICMNECLDIEIRDSPQERMLGLMYRETLPLNAGMLFIFDSPKEQSFWMKNMKFPIDMIFISKELKIVKVYSDIPPCLEEPCQHYVAEDAMYVLETNANYSLKQNVHIGDKVKIFI